MSFKVGDMVTTKPMKVITPLYEPCAQILVEDHLGRKQLFAKDNLIPSKNAKEDQIKHMVNRFLMWKLPADFHPDAGISFVADYNQNTQWPAKHEPVGTNLLTADQAETMVRHMLEGL